MYYYIDNLQTVYCFNLLIDIKYHQQKLGYVLRLLDHIPYNPHDYDTFFRIQAKKLKSYKKEKKLQI